MKSSFSSAFLAVTTAVISSFTLVGSASAASMVDPVNFGSQATSDAYNNVFNKLKEGERQELDTTIAPAGSRLVDLNNLFLNYDSDISITFLGEGTRKKNDFAYSVNGNDPSNIWKNINAEHNSEADFLSTEQDSGDPQNGKMTYGDSMSLGSFKEGDQFEFLLTPQYSGVHAFDPGEKGQKRKDVMYSSITENSVNGDGLQHAIAYALSDRYMILGFEDQFGEFGQTRREGGEKSDRDFNDILFLVDLGEGNLASVPEPATASALFAAGALGLFGVRRRKNSV